MANKGKLFLVNEDFVDKPQLDWRERFLKSEWAGDDVLEDFIAEVEKLAEERGRNEMIIIQERNTEIIRSSLKAELIERGEKMKKDDPGADGQYDAAAMYGYNQAISDYQNIIKGVDI